MPTVEQAHAARKTFPCPRVDPLSERDAAALAQVLTQRPVAVLVVELHAVTRPMTYLSPSSRREVVAAGMARHGP